MGLNIDVEKVRQSLLKERDEIDEKIKALDIVENLAMIQNSHNIVDGVYNEISIYDEMTLKDAAKSIFVNNPNKEFLISEIEEKLRKGGKKGNYGHTTIGSTLKRLVNDGDLQVRKSGNKNRFKLRKKP
ncbi:MAG: hypothetical protein JW837_11530 [Sedimentisphaerales bacterium]|nr:hypothetical protein [Sedimentisphaerales bacterium]